MKKLFIVFLILPILFFCGFKKNKNSYVVLSSANNAVETTSEPRLERYFNVRQRIYYTLVAPKKFKYAGVRLQISKRDEKTSNWGLSVIQSEDIIVDTSQNVYRNYIFIQQPGYYILQFFYLNNKDYPFVHTEFVVQ